MGNSYFVITCGISEELIGYIRAKNLGGSLQLGLDLATEFQGMGIGTQLWKFLLSSLSDFNFNSCNLRVLKTNERALKLYSNLGFKQNSETEFDKSFWLDLQEFRESALPTFIYTVMGPKDESFVNLNLMVTQNLNLGKRLTFMLSIQDEEWSEFKELPILRTSNKILVQHGDFRIRPQEEDLFRRARASLYHARALENLFRVPISNSSKVVILDPDFYVFKENWIDQFFSKLDSHKLFFGAGYHPKHITSYKNFPTPYFMMFDSTQVSLSKLNFYPNPANTEEWPDFEKKITLLMSGFNRFKRLILPLSSMLTWRRKLSNDTGHQIAKDFTSKKAICLTVAVRKSDYFVPLHLRTSLGRLAESLFFSKTFFGLMPARNNYCEQDLTRVSNPAWDEYYDDREIVAFHVRKSFSISVYETSLYSEVQQEVIANLTRFCGEHLN